jgi:hypothetical protein
LQARSWLLEHDPDGPEIFEWSNTVAAPETPEAMAGEIVWIILCAGRKAQAARTICARVWEAIHAGQPVASVFRYLKKAAAIERAWHERVNDFAMLQDVLQQNDALKLLEWCRSIPFIGEDTQYQLAKNFAAPTCKPDIHLTRLCGLPDRPRRPLAERYAACMALCRMLSAATGDRIAAVDSILWLACNKGVLSTDPDANPITLHTGAPRARSIYEVGPSISADTARGTQLLLELDHIDSD